ncbi:acetolactate decarboxylase [bacterium]|nr:acetolactate decarboxylase [bacterium]
MIKFQYKDSWMLIICFLFFSTVFGQNDILTQISTIDALLNGIYEGETTIQALGERGDFGIGTFNGLDGEMVVLDGHFYQVTSNGTVHIPSPEIKTPFAAVTFFETDKKQQLGTGIDFQIFQREMDDLIPTQNIFYAIMIKGIFKTIQTRSVPKQVEPYPLLSDIVNSQPVFDFENVEGIIVGFRCPPYISSIAVPGYHLHFLTNDRKSGGHVLDFTVDEAVLEIDETHQFFMFLPESQDFYNLDLTINREEELKKVEQASPDMEAENGNP